jgi:hypothetical protein
MLAMATIFLLSILAGYDRNMKLVIELEREVDGRWIGDIADLNFFTGKPGKRLCGGRRMRPGMLLRIALRTVNCRRG